MTVGLTGAIVITTIGFSVFDYLKSGSFPIKPSKNDNYTSDTFEGLDTTPTVPGISTDSSDTVPPTEFDSFVPEQDIQIEDGIIAENNFDESMVKILALLTNATRNYIESVTGKKSDATHISIDHIVPNENSVVIYGKGQSGSKVKRLVVTIDNFRLSGYSSDPNEFAAQLAADLEMGLQSSNTQYSVKVESYYKVSNPQIAKTLLQSRLAELKNSNPSSPEVAFITDLLSNPGAIELLVIEPTSVKTENNTRKTAYRLLMSTKEYGYTAQSSFETAHQLRGEDRYPAIENHLTENVLNIELNSEPQSEINKGLYIINQEAKELENNNSLGK